MIIGVSGKAGAGKDTVCKMIAYTIWYHTSKPKFRDYGIEHYLEVIYNYEDMLKEIEYEHKAFASNMKLCLSNILNVPVNKFEDQDYKSSIIDWIKIDDHNPTVRELLQKFGTAIRDGVCDDFWVQTCLGNASEDCLISDVRFKSEAEGIKEIGGVLIRVNRDSAGAGNHISEVELDDYIFNWTIDNNGTLEELLEKVRQFLIYFDLI